LQMMNLRSNKESARVYTIVLARTHAAEERVYIVYGSPNTSTDDVAIWIQSLFAINSLLTVSHLSGLYIKI
jgi:hypothetical protein